MLSRWEGCEGKQPVWWLYRHKTDYRHVHISWLWV